MDDNIVTSTKQGFISHLICALSTQLFLKDLGPLYYFLSIEGIPHSFGIIFSQHKYILDLLYKVGLSDAKPIITSLSTLALLTKLLALYSLIYQTTIR